MNSIQTFVLIFGDKYIPNITKLYRILYVTIIYHIITIITISIQPKWLSHIYKHPQYNGTQANTNLLTDATLDQDPTKAHKGIYFGINTLKILNLRLLTYFIIFALYISLSSDGKTLYHLVNNILSVLGTESVGAFSN